MNQLEKKKIEQQQQLQQQGQMLQSQPMLPGQPNGARGVPPQHQSGNYPGHNNSGSTTTNNINMLTTHSSHSGLIPIQPSPFSTSKVYPHQGQIPPLNSLPFSHNPATASHPPSFSGPTGTSTKHFQNNSSTSNSGAHSQSSTIPGVIPSAGPPGKSGGGSGASLLDEVHLSKINPNELTSVERITQHMPITDEDVTKEENSAHESMRMALPGVSRGIVGKIGLPAGSRHLGGTGLTVSSLGDNIAGDRELWKTFNLLNESKAEHVSRKVLGPKDMKIESDAVQALSHGIQNHMSSIVATCIANTRRRTNRTVSDTYRQLREVIRHGGGGVTPEVRKSLGMLWGPDSAAEIEDEIVTHNKLFNNSIKLEEMYVKKLIATCEDDRKQNQRKRSSSAAGTSATVVATDLIAKQVIQ
jgi:hypothetical protein